MAQNKAFHFCFPLSRLLMETLQIYPLLLSSQASTKVAILIFGLVEPLPHFSHVKSASRTKHFSGFLTFPQVSWHCAAFGLAISQERSPLFHQVLSLRAITATLLQVTQCALKGSRQTICHVLDLLWPAAPKHSALELLTLLFAYVEEHIWPLCVRRTVSDVSEVSLGELSSGADLFHLDVTWPHDQGVLLAQLLRSRRSLQQMGDGDLGLLHVQGVDFLCAQIVHLEEWVAMRQRLGAVMAKAVMEKGGRFPQRAHELQWSPQGHGC